MRDFIGKLFGFTVEVEAAYDLMRHKENTIDFLEKEIELLRKERDEFKQKLFESIGIVKPVEQTITESNFESIRHGRSFNSIRRKLEQKAVSPVKILETEQDIQESLNKKNAS